MMCGILQMKNGWIEEEWGIKIHYVDDVIHNADGPATIWPDGHQTYYQRGVLHREDGPAIIYSYGDVRYYLFGILVEEEHLVIMGLSEYPKEGFSKEQVMMFGLLCMG